MFDDEQVTENLDDLMVAAFAGFSPEIQELLMAQRGYIEQSFGEMPRGGYSSLVMLAIFGDNSGSMKNDELLTEAEEAEGVVPLMLYERLIEGLNEGVIDGLQGSGVAAKIEVLLDLLNYNKGYVRQVTDGSDHFEWTPVLSKPPHFISSPQFIANGNRVDGGTPLRRRIVQALASGIVRAHWLSQPPLNLQTTAKYLFLTDGESTESGRHCIQEEEVQQLLAELPASHQPYFLGLENDRVDFRDVGRSLGFRDDRVEELPRNGKELRHFLSLWSQSQAEGVDDAPVSDGEVVAMDDDELLSDSDPFFGDGDLSLGDDDFAAEDDQSNSDAGEESAFGRWLS
jgi:hypothetical protein